VFKSIENQFAHTHTPITDITTINNNFKLLLLISNFNQPVLSNLTLS